MLIWHVCLFVFNLTQSRTKRSFYLHIQIPLSDYVMYVSYYTVLLWLLQKLLSTFEGYYEGTLTLL